MGVVLNSLICIFVDSVIPSFIPLVVFVSVRSDFINSVLSLLIYVVMPVFIFAVFIYCCLSFVRDLSTYLSILWISCGILSSLLACALVRLMYVLRYLCIALFTSCLLSLFLMLSLYLSFHPCVFRRQRRYSRAGTSGSHEVSGSRSSLVPPRRAVPAGPTFAKCWGLRPYCVTECWSFPAATREH